MGGASDPPADGRPPGLRCPDCGRSYDAGPDEPWRCGCDAPLEIDAAPSLPSTPPVALDRDRGLWAFADWLPVAPRATLGEGWTPLVDAPAFDCAFKLEYVFPSGSFKDRGATATLSRAAGLGVRTVVDDSSGNAGAAIAQYAARAGIDARIYVPADVKPAKLAAIERVGADPVRVEGDRAAVTDACVDAVERGEGWYASHAWNPAFFAGTSTFAFELAAQRGWTAPDAVVLPVGHGTLLLGAFRGFRALADAGLIAREPRLFAVQAAGVAPVADAVGSEAAAAATEALGGDRTADTADAADDDAVATGRASDANELADGIQIEHPARRSELLRAIRETDGDAVAVGEATTREALARLRRAGFYVEPTCAAAPVGLAAYREAGILDADDVVVVLSGSGLKS
jgi:threonine synthase